MVTQGRGRDDDDVEFGDGTVKKHFNKPFERTRAHITESELFT